MDQESKNIEKIINVMSVFMGIRLIKQILCVILLIFGVEEKRIIAGLKVSPNTVIKYANLINSGRLSELFEDNLYRPKSKLEDYRGEILTELDKNPVHTLREAAVVIEKISGLKRSIPQVRNFLKKTIIVR